MRVEKICIGFWGRNALALRVHAIVVVLSLASTPSHSGEIKRLTIAYKIDERRVEELYSAILFVFGYVNNIEFDLEGGAQHQVLSIMSPGIIEDGKILPENIDYLDEEIWKDLEEAEYRKGTCLVQNMTSPWKEKMSDGTLSVTDKIQRTTLVVRDTRNADVETQMQCLLAGIVAVANPMDYMSQLQGLHAKELAAGLINGKFLPGFEN